MFKMKTLLRSFINAGVVLAIGIICLTALVSCGSTTKPITRTTPAEEKTAFFDFEKRTVRLNNGIEMPIIGIGTFTLTPAEAEESVYHALLDGYRLIDTANAYMNERAVGRGIKRSGVPREEIFITTKLWPADYEDVERAIDDTLARLDVEYIDLFQSIRHRRIRLL
jgi:hypothetical protein